jgi:transposase
MGRKALIPNRQYTAEFKVEAMRLAESIGVSQASVRLGIPESSLWYWVKAKRAGRPVTSEAPPSAPKDSAAVLAAENARLKRELAEAKLDLEIVKKAAAYFAKESR